MEKENNEMKKLKKTSVKKIRGKDVKELQIFGQQFYTGYIEVRLKRGQKWYRLPIIELLKLMPNIEFTVEKKIKHSYLTIINKEK